MRDPLEDIATVQGVSREEAEEGVQAVLNAVSGRGKGKLTPKRRDVVARNRSKRECPNCHTTRCGWLGPCPNPPQRPSEDVTEATEDE